MGMKIEGLDELEKSLRSLTLGDANAIAKKAVAAAAPTVKDALARQISATTHGTGDLAASLEYRPPRENIYGIYTVVRPSGRDRNGTSNALKMSVLENGRKGGVGATGRKIAPQPPRPVRDAAVASVEDEVVATMQRVVEDEIAKIVR